MDRATQSPVMGPMKITSDAVRLMRNRRGLFVITHADGLESHAEEFFEPPDRPAPAANQYRLAIEDPQRRYLPRLLMVRLPRDPDPDNVANPDSLFTPQDVAMYPASTASLAHNWSSVRVAVSQGPDARTAPPLRGVLIRIIDIENEAVLASGISDLRGEALVVVPGVPVTKFADEEEEGPPEVVPPGGGHEDEPAVLVHALAVRLELSFAAGGEWPVNPDLLERNHESNRRVSMGLELVTGRMERLAINLTS
ncbi:MAG: hypothetical protein U5S82_21030 [Gammaproteobacteria bacterium]|nr:hypothetical protein [Gammaproteobacteria bacterium]